MLVSVTWSDVGRVLEQADRVASVLTLLSLLAGAAFYSGVLRPLRISVGLVKVVESENDPTKRHLLLEVHVFNRTRYEQTVREVVVFDKPSLGSRSRRWWRPFRWRRRAHEVERLTDDRNAERVRLGDRGDDSSRLVPSRGVLIVRILYRQPPADGVVWTSDIVDRRCLYAGATFDGRRSASRRVRRDDMIVNPFGAHRAAITDADLATARLAAAQSAVAAALAAATAAAAAATAAAKTAEAADAAFRSLAPKNPAGGP